MQNHKTERLESLDILRGFDLFCLVCFQPVFIAFGKVVDTPWMNILMKPFEHVAWEGFTFWDIIMPLFMFMAGVSMPFAFAKYFENKNRTNLYMKIIKRFFLLWIFGMMCQGNLLALDFQRIYFYSNTLQAIAMGYLISALLILNFKLRGQIISVIAFLLISWTILTFVKNGSWGGGSFGPDNNFAEYIDRMILGRFRNRVTQTDTGLDFGNYRYTWILSSMNFGVTVMTGVFAGQILKSEKTPLKKLHLLLLIGVALIVAGQLWSLQMPIIKKIWTSSMTLFSSGICFLLMALFYYIIDYKKIGKGLKWLKIYGMNSILAYMLYSIVDFSGVIHSILYGVEQYIGNYYGALLQMGSVSVISLILWIMYKNQVFLKV